MEDVKDKMKGFMKKVNNPFSSSSSGKFKGQGRVLGSSSSSSSSSGAASSGAAAPASYSSASSNPVHARPAQVVNPKPSPKKPASSPHDSSNSVDKPVATHFLPDKKDDDSNSSRSEGFDPYGSLVTSAKRSQNGYTLNVFECPVCLSQAFRSEEEVSIHVDTCINGNSVRSHSNDDIGVNCVSEPRVEDSESCSEIDACVGSFLSGNPSEGSIEVVVRLFRNIVKEPGNAKFRKIRMSNPKIREAIGDVSGGVELLEFVGFELREDGGEMWAAMEVPTEERIVVINKVLSLFEQQKIESSSSFIAPAAEPEVKEQVKPTKVDREIRVFFSVSESVAAKIELPDSFYNLSYEEMRREAELKKKKLAESQLLVPKSFKEKQAKASRKKYKRTMIRIQFPDGVVLQGVFAPWETTGALYEFVSSALKDGSLEFQLLHPLLIRRRVIPHFPAAGMKAITLDEEDLVPSALIKFKPIETDSTPFTGLSNELLQISEPL